MHFLKGNDFFLLICNWFYIQRVVIVVSMRVKNLVVFFSGIKSLLKNSPSSFKHIYISSEGFHYAHCQITPIIINEYKRFSDKGEGSQQLFNGSWFQESLTVIICKLNFYVTFNPCVVDKFCLSTTCCLCQYNFLLSFWLRV